jgi:hypothetical protein
MRITGRQLRQIIREELHRGMHEAEGDDDGTGQTKLPAEPKKRGFLDKVFGPSEETLAWNAEWSKLSQGEKDAYVAFVKRDPELPTILGTAVKNKQFDIRKFREFLDVPGAYDSGELRRLVGARQKYASRSAFDDRLPRETGPLVLPDGFSLPEAINSVSYYFSTQLSSRAQYLQRAAYGLGGKQTGFDRVLFENSDLMAALESYYREDIKINHETGKITIPPVGSPLRRFTDAAMPG